MNRIGVCPGTFDPITNGHLDIVSRSLKFFDTVIVAVALNPLKTPLFDIKERLEMIADSTTGLTTVQVEAFDGLLVDYLKRKGAHGIIRGLRAVSDFEYELQMAMMNRHLDQTVETLFLMPSVEYSFLTSTIIKTVASYGGSIDGLVPPLVARRLRAKFSTRADRSAP
ncbi:MAG: pantetheine-phosphate adenylyltransferase [Nitrospirae bacterium]|nr:pantetheine-phosphate adenylyltransferase [Nitrospirota bacterium]